MANVTLTSKAKIVILFANQYDMKDEAGDKLAGCSVHYMFWGENGEVLASEAEFDPTKPVGVQLSLIHILINALRWTGFSANDIG